MQNYVNGTWRPPDSDDEHSVVNPATGEQLATIAFSTTDEVEEAVAAGTAAFEEWGRLPVEERVQPLFQLKTLLEDHQNDPAEQLTTEHGKTLAEARGELRHGIENVEVACGIPSLLQSGTLSNAAPNIDESTIRQPLGVFAAVTPFNFPSMIPLWFLPYAVATGNSFILKPSEQTPLTAAYPFELISEAGFPDGVVQLVHGSQATVEALIDHDDVTGVSFVGSTPVARSVYERAATNGKRVQAQGGAKNHVIVADSADVEFAAEQSISSALACSGERCLANDIVLVDRSVHEEYVDHLVRLADDQVLGDGRNPETDVGPLITAEHEEHVRDLVETGIEEGANLVYDSREAAVEKDPTAHGDVAAESDADGNFLGPCIFDGVTPEMTIAREELFGPVFGITPVDDLDEALSILNRSRFGNAASLFTASGSDARRFRHEAEAGNLAVNAGTAAPMAFFHFGGRKDSFFGDLHSQGEDMIQFYTDKTIYIERWPGQ